MEPYITACKTGYKWTTADALSPWLLKPHFARDLKKLHSISGAAVF
jgi:hypothetical protein